MKVTAFIRKTAAKNNITDQARVYFRVRDIGGVDWSPERQGYKPRVALVSEEKKMAFDKDVQQITHLITKEYHRGVDGNWLKSLIEEYHHPNINARGGNKADEYLLSYQIRKYIEETPLADESRKHHLDNLNKVLRYERFRHEVLHQRGFHLCIDTITADDIRDFKLWMQEEYRYVDMYPVFYRNEKHRDVGQKRSERCRAEAFREQHVGLALPHPHRRQVVHQARTDKEQPLRSVPDSPADVRRPVLPDTRRAGQGVLRRPERHGTDLSRLP